MVLCPLELVNLHVILLMCQVFRTVVTRAMYCISSEGKVHRVQSAPSSPQLQITMEGHPELSGSPVVL